jgi:hypothetical protein
MLQYLLDKDARIGHALIVHRTGLFTRELYLKPVYYNDLITRISEGVSGDTYETIRNCLSLRTLENDVNTYSLRNGGSVIRGRSIDARIRSLQYRFANQYFERAAEILEKERKKTEDKKSKKSKNSSKKDIFRTADNSSKGEIFKTIC